MSALWHPGLLDYLGICAVLGLLSQIPSLLVWCAKLRESRLVSDDRFISPTAARQHDEDFCARTHEGHVRRMRVPHRNEGWSGR